MNQIMLFVGGVVIGIGILPIAITFEHRNEISKLLDFILTIVGIIILMLGVLLIDYYNDWP